MKITLDTEELISLVSQHMKSLGLVGDYKITFNKRNQNNVDTYIEILDTSCSKNEPKEHDRCENDSSTNKESHIDSLIK
ncbi:MAG: hypothetical protein L3I99_01835 [Sulfurimonas sp.]|nr:hypothetical protein [Sulfurimonas sp.]